MSDYEERDPYGETRPVPEIEAAPQAGQEYGPQPAADPGAGTHQADYDAETLDHFDAFRARRAQERAQQEPFPGQAQGYTDPAAFPLSAPPPYEQYTQVAAPIPAEEPMVRAPRRRLRSAIVFGGVAALVVGVGAGVWAVTGSSAGSPTPAAAGTPSASAPASPGSKAAKSGKAAVTARLTVTSVGSDSFTGTTARGVTVVVHITSATRFGTAARPFTRAQLVPGAQVVARLRKETDGTVYATVIAAPTATASAQPSASDSSAGAA